VTREAAISHLLSNLAYDNVHIAATIVIVIHLASRATTWWRNS